MRLGNLNFRLKASILVFLTSITFFMGFVLIEDLLILRDILNGAEGWDGTRRGIRLGFALCFSILITVITYLSFNLFYGNLRNLIQFIQSWREDGDREDIRISRNDEIGNLLRSLQIAIYQEEERHDKITKKTLFFEKANLTNKIQERIQSIPLQRIPGLDVSIFPNSNRKPAQDLVHILRTEEGCVGLISGYDTAGVRENSFKVSLHFTLQFLYNLQTKNGHEIFRAMSDSIVPDPVGLLNFTWFTLSSDSGELNYHSYQEIPPIIWSEDGIRELDRPLRKFVDTEGVDRDQSQHSVLYEREWLIVFSDRILKTIQLTPQQFLNEMKLRIFDVDDIHSNSRELTISIANHITKRYGKKALDRLGLIAIKRSA